MSLQSLQTTVKTSIRSFSSCQALLRGMGSLDDQSPYENQKSISKLKVHQRTHESSRIGIIGVPFHKGQSSSGVEEAPSALREFGMVKQMISIGHNVKDFGDIICENIGERNDVPDKIRSLPDLACASHALSSKVQEVMREHRKVLTIGGDHSIALGSVDGHIQAKNGEICLLWVDAHADLNTADTSESGHMHGMPVSLLVKELADYWPYLPGLDWQKPTMSIKNLAYIGLRSVDHYERLIIEKYGVSAYGMEDIEKYGIHAVTTLALERINPTGTKSLHVSFDIDALDTLEAPCTGTSVRGGLTLREGVHIMEIAHRTGWLGAVDMVEINPRLGNILQVKTTLEAATHIIKAAFGFSRSGHVPQHIEKLPGYYAPILIEDKVVKREEPIVSAPFLEKS
ncbi:hypothetical protein GE061_018726 [Apolygus lucorum]|uniref:Arginase n=1 Tax=Apolygus lucorum TaxID=248454 RepID=A0A6A4JFX0_APOLU|nr:hypothetical protein GE061_018726 [Apolygus lucorum]